MMLHKSFKPAKCKTTLNLAKSRIKLMKNKKDVQFRQLKREVAQLLQNGQDQTARIRVEHVVREEKMMAAYEMIEIYCELIVARLPIIESQKTCPLDLKEAITSLLFAAPRCGDIPELQDVRKHFTAKYGKEFVTAAIEIRPQCGVSRTLVEKLSAKAPDGPTKVNILKGIAEENNIQWEPNWFKDEDPLSSSEILKTPQAEKSSKIQMEPLDAQFADDHYDKHTLDTEHSGTVPIIHNHADSNKVQPSSSSHRDSVTAENVSSSDRQYWNMEFKDATAAAQAAAESAERASIAARAAAELASGGRVSVSTYEPSHSFVQGHSKGEARYSGGVSQNEHDQGKPISSSFDQRSPRLQGSERASNQRDSMTERTNVRGTNNDDIHFEQQRGSRQHNLSDGASSFYPLNSDQRKQSEDFASFPKTSEADQHGLFDSSNFDSEPAENPFHEETVKLQNQHSNIHSMPIPYGDADDVFSNWNSRSDKNYFDDSSSAFNQGTSLNDDWHVRTAYQSEFNSNAEDVIFSDEGRRKNFLGSNETKHLFHSSSGVSGGVEQRISGVNVDEMVSPVVFDEYNSDVDDCLSDQREESKSSSGVCSPKNSSLHQDSHKFEPDLSESFRKSPIYSKLIEPLPVFDDLDGASSESDTDSKTKNSEYEIGIYSSRKSDRDSGVNSGFIRQSSAEKGSVEPFVGIKHMEKNQSAYIDSDDEDMVQDSPRSKGFSLESKGRFSKFDSETRSSSQDGMELNLGSLPGGRRNRFNRRPSYTNARGGLADVSSPSRSFRAGTSDAFDGNEKSYTGQMVNRQAFIELNSSGDELERGGTQERSDIVERPYRGGILENQYKTRTKDSTGYFESDDSASEEEVFKPVPHKKNLLGVSRRTKMDSTGLVASSRPSTFSGDVEKRQFPISSPVTKASEQSKITSSSSRSAHQSSWDTEVSSPSRSDTRSSKIRNSFSPAVVEKPLTPVAAEIPRAAIAREKAPSRENSGKMPSHVHPKLPDFESLTAHLESLRTNRQ